MRFKPPVSKTSRFFLFHQCSSVCRAMQGRYCSNFCFSYLIYFELRAPLEDFPLQLQQSRWNRAPQVALQHWVKFAASDYGLVHTCAPMRVCVYCARLCLLYATGGWQNCKNYVLWHMFSGIKLHYGYEHNILLSNAFGAKDSSGEVYGAVSR